MGTIVSVLWSYVRFVGSSPRLILQLALSLLFAALVGGVCLAGLNAAQDRVITVPTAGIPTLIHAVESDRIAERLGLDLVVAASDSNAATRAHVDMPQVLEDIRSAWQQLQQYDPRSLRADGQTALLARANALFRQGQTMANQAAALDRTAKGRPESQRLLHQIGGASVFPLHQQLVSLIALDEAAVAQTGNETASWLQVTSWRVVAAVLLSVLTVDALYVVMAAREYRRRTTTQEMADMVAFVDGPGAIRYVSPTFEQALGRPAAAVLNHPVLEYVHPGDAEAARAALEGRCNNQTDPTERELRIHHADGSYRWLAVTAVSKLQDPLIRAIVVTCHDVTARKEAERALQTSEARLRTVIAHAPILVFALDGAGRFTLLEGGSLSGSEDVPRPSMGQSIQEWLQEVSAQPSVRERVQRGEAVSTDVTVGEQVFDVWWSPAAADEDAEGQVGTGVAVDVTDRVLAQREADRARTTAEELARLRSDFVASISHELRTPLTAIVGYGELLQAHWDQLGDAMRRDRLGRIVAAANRQKRLVDDLLLVSRLDTQRLSLRVQAVHLASVIDRAAQEIAGAYAQQRFELLGPAELQARADPDRTAQIIANLLDNAAKYSHEGTRITVTWQGAGDAVVVRVADQGSGIPEASRELLFTRFGRVPGSQVRSGHVGTGLGLYLGRDLARAMGGDLEVESTGPEGTVFRLRLPAVLAPS